MESKKSLRIASEQSLRRKIRIWRSQGPELRSCISPLSLTIQKKGTTVVLEMISTLNLNTHLKDQRCQRAQRTSIRNKFLHVNKSLPVKLSVNEVP